MVCVLWCLVLQKELHTEHMILYLTKNAFSLSIMQGFETIQDAVLRQVHDKDLSIVRAALSLNELPNVVNRTDLLQALCSITQRCIGILVSSKYGEKTTMYWIQGPFSLFSCLYLLGIVYL